MLPAAEGAFSDQLRSGMQESPDSHELFAAFRRTRPLRTYSHKGRNGRAVSLPALKPDVIRSPPRDSSARVQRFRIGNAKSSEVKSSWRVSAEHLQTVRTDQAHRKENQDRDHGIEGRVVHVQETDQVARRSSASNQEEKLPSPITSAPPSQASDSTEQSEVSGADDEDDDDDLIILSQQPCDHAPKHLNHTLNRRRTLRRHPFLMFDKTEQKGYKQLKDKPQHNKTPPSRYQPGDGFSGGEAKPNGANLLTRHGKLSFAGPHVGILDLTQSDPSPPKPKRNVRRANLEDNSFVPALKKQARRPLEPKDPNLQQTLAKASLTQMKISSSAVEPAANTGIDRAAQAVETENKHPEKDHTQNKGAPGTSLHQHGAEENMAEENMAEEDARTGSSRSNPDTATVGIERSDDSQGSRSKSLQRHGVLVDEGPDSCETHVSDTPPPHQLRIEANPRSPAPSLQRHVSAGTAGLPERAFRRVNTQ